MVNEDQVVVLETQTMVEKLTKKDNFFSAMIRNLNFVAAVVESLVMATSSLQQADNALQAAKQASGKRRISASRQILYYHLNIQIYMIKDFQYSCTNR